MGAQHWAGHSRDLAAVLKGTVLPGLPARMGEERYPRDIKGPAQGQARRVAPVTAAAWPDLALVPLPGQPSAGTPSTRCWLPGRRRSPPPRGTSRQTGPARPAQVFPCAGGLWGGGHAARWPLRPRAQLQLSHFLTVGGGKGHGHPGASAPIPAHRLTASSQAQVGAHPREPWPQPHGHPPCL